MNQSWFAPIDAYCERHSHVFWAEPLNALTNAAFLVAALCAILPWWRRDAWPRWQGGVLIGLIAVIGVGSFLFHTFANRWSLLADVVPIAVFILVYFALAMRRYFSAAWLWAIMATIGFQLAAAGAGAAWASVVAARGSDPLNGSFGYMPALAAMLIMGALLSRRPASVRSGRALLLGAAVFAASLTFRTLDNAACSVVPMGTHFMWHCLNAVLLYLLCVALFGAPLPAEAGKRTSKGPSRQSSGA